MDGLYPLNFPIFQTPYFMPPPTSYFHTDRDCIRVDGRGNLGHEVRSLKFRRMEGTWAHL
jgi:hypothetical protein